MTSADIPMIVMTVLVVVSAAAAISSLVGPAAKDPPIGGIQIQNLAYVGSGVWRSAQPTTAQAWQALYARGIRHVLKLNFDTEGDDALALAAGMTVERLPLQPEGDRDIAAEIVGTFVEPDQGKLDAAVAMLGTSSPGDEWLVHCTHGQDRTGLVVAMYRVRRDGWTREAALDEARRYGFHVELEGLMAAWLRFRG
jgi:hypothetical protein